MSRAIWGPGVWRDFNRVDDGDLPMTDGRRFDVSEVRASSDRDNLSPGIMGAHQGDRIRDFLGLRRPRGRSAQRSRDEY